MDKPLPAPVKELRKTESGRKIIADLQKKYHNELVQPNINGRPNPEFEKLYGERNRRQQKEHERQVKEATAQREYREEAKKVWIKRQKDDPTYKKFF